MHTLILNGSPRPAGDTSFFIQTLKNGLKGTITQVDCYRAHISPCIDCRFCVKNSGCAIEDDMQALYPIIETCDRVVIATPVYFSLPTAPLLGVMSRLQTYFCSSHFRREPVPFQNKLGGIILVGGGSGSAKPAEETLIRLLKCMHVKEIGPMVCSLNTDITPAYQDKKAVQQLNNLLVYLNNER